MPTVNVERIVERADATLKRASAPHLRRIRETSNEAYRRLAAEIRRKWPEALEQAAGAAPNFAEARARLLLEQLQPYLSALDYGDPASGVPAAVRDMIVTGAENGAETAAELLNAYGVGSAAELSLGARTAVIDQRALEAATRNSRARLARHGADAIRKIEDTVVSALVRGQGPQRITREIREALRGDGRIPAGGLHFRAETIAETELANAKAEASRERYAETGVEFVQWYATLDERTCPWCGHRHGMVYPRDGLVIPAHPRCRCYAAPFRREFTEAGLVDTDMWRAQQAEIRERVPQTKSGLTPFERANGRTYPKAAWTPSSGWTGA